MGNALVCPACGRAIQQPGPCPWCGSYPDPYAALDNTPRTQPADPYLMGQPWVAPTAVEPAFEPAPAAPLPQRSNGLIAVIGVLSFAVLMGMGVVAYLVFGRGESPTAAVPEPTTPSAAASSPSLAPTPRPTRTATVFVTVDPEQVPGGAGNEPAPVPVDGQPLSQTEAEAGIVDYLWTVAGNPAAGWELLTERRQRIEDEAAYYEYWSNIASATVEGCVQEAAGSLLCQFSTIDNAGRHASSEVRYWMTAEDGEVKVDVAGGRQPEHLAAEQTLEEYRQETLGWLVLDGRWVAELSAKRPGISDPLQIAANGSHVFYFPDILAEHEQLSDRLPGVDVLMLRREDWGKQGRDLWHTVADPGGFTSEADVEAWCATAFPELTGDALHNQCTPRQLKPPYWS